jgi:uncharacterized protein (DUF4213/DUF364 family)
MSPDPWRLYDLLLERIAPEDPRVAELIIGISWTLCRGAGWGLAMSPCTPIRTLAWPGTLAGRPVRELAGWLRSWDPYEATVAMAAANSLINAESALAASATPLFPESCPNLAVFAHFAERLAGRRVVVVGHYPGLEDLDLGWELSVLERKPGPGDLPDPAAEYLLPRADWVFLTATSIINKTFPRLAELSREANLVLMGPTVPWLEELSGFGVDYLAGVQAEDGEGLRATVAEGEGRASSRPGCATGSWTFGSGRRSVCDRPSHTPRPAARISSRRWTTGTVMATAAAFPAGTGSRP